VTPHEKTKYHAARYIYHKANKATPSGKYTWREWWEQKFSDGYDEYVERLKNETD
jgi:hypothetical protein